MTSSLVCTYSELRNTCTIQCTQVEQYIDVKSRFTSWPQDMGYTWQGNVGDDIKIKIYRSVLSRRLEKILSIGITKWF